MPRVRTGVAVRATRQWDRLRDRTRVSRALGPWDIDEGTLVGVPGHHQSTRHRRTLRNLPQLLQKISLVLYLSTWVRGGGHGRERCRNGNGHPKRRRKGN